MKPFPTSGSQLQGQALTLKNLCIKHLVSYLINKHLTSYTCSPKLRNHIPLALKRLNDLPRFILLNKIGSYEIEMFSFFFTFIFFFYLLRVKFIRQR